MDVRGKRFLIVGLARSGLAAANFLLKRGAQVSITDKLTEERLRPQLDQVEGQALFSLGGHRLEDFLGADLVILSPGVPRSTPEVAEALERGIPVWSEVELAFRFLRGPIIGVTGSNGKTTTASLLGYLAQRAGRPVVVAGNIGTPLVSAADRSDEPLFVVELSSFQLETIDRFRCHLAMFLNATPDHLDRYAGFDDYVKAKKRIFLNQEARDYAILNADDGLYPALVSEVGSQVFPFSRRQALREGVFVRDGGIVCRRQGREERLLEVGDLLLRGSHNLENALAASAAAVLSGFDPQAIRQGLRDFAGVEHRLELCRSLDGVEFYNDSKATNVDATVKALESFSGSVIAIMGGLDKGGDFEALSEPVRSRVKRLLLIGAAAGKISAALGSQVPTQRAGTLQEAVATAWSEARPGDFVLLAPGCASFDQFDNFEHRGRVFKQLVSQLESKSDADSGPGRPQPATARRS